MNRKEHLLVILMEECNEVAHRASKALRFGMSEIQPGQPLTNAERLTEEFNDLFATMQMIQTEYPYFDILVGGQQRAKREKIEKFLEYSAKQGTLD